LRVLHHPVLSVPSCLFDPTCYPAGLNPPIVMFFTRDGPYFQPPCKHSAVAYVLPRLFCPPFLCRNKTPRLLLFPFRGGPWGLHPRLPRPPSHAPSPRFSVFVWKCRLPRCSRGFYPSFRRCPFFAFEESSFFCFGCSHHLSLTPVWITSVVRVFLPHCSFFAVLLPEISNSLSHCSPGFPPANTSERTIFRRTILT